MENIGTVILTNDSMLSILDCDVIGRNIVGEGTNSLRDLFPMDVIENLKSYIQNTDKTVFKVCCGKFIIKGNITEKRKIIICEFEVLDFDLYSRRSEIEEMRYNLLLESVGNTVIEICMDNTIDFYSNGARLKPKADIEGNITIQDLIEQNNLVHTEDIEQFNDLLEMARGGISHCLTEIRLLSEKNVYIWCEVGFYTVKNENESIQRILIIIKDINKDRILRNSLLKRVNKDGLTGLYNKKSGEELIKSVAATCESCILVFFDIDNFKGINDTYGHLEGDNALKGVAQSMLSTFRANDVLCRFGGDEFCMLLLEIPLGVAISKVTELQEKVNNIVICGEKPISISLGLVEYRPEYDITLNELYNRADTALYEAKNNGKKGYRVFRNE